MTNVVQRQTDAANQIWFEQTESKTSIGFTEQFLTVVRDCWHVVPAMEGKVNEKSPLFAIETNDSLLTIFSPTKGTIVHFSQTAQNFPDKLTSEDVVCLIDSEAPETKKVKSARPTAQGGIRPNMANIGGAPVFEQWAIDAPPEPRAMHAPRDPGRPGRPQQNPFVAAEVVRQRLAEIEQLRRNNDNGPELEF